MNKLKTDLKKLDALSDKDIANAVARDSDAAPLMDNLEGFRRSRGPQKAPTKQPVYIRLSPEVVEHFKAGGAGWQVRIDEALRDHVKRQ